MFKCPNCAKVYKNNGKWLRKHMIETCHVMHLKATELVEKQDNKLDNILTRINSLESMIRNIKVVPQYHDDSIERIKQEESAKITDPALRKYKHAFQECISELKEVLKIRKNQIENGKELDISQLTLVRD